MKKRLNQHGFSAVMALLIVVIVAGVGFAGWYVYNSNKKTDKVLESSTKTTNPTPTPTPTATTPDGQKTYTDSKYKISFNYPEDATVSADYNSTKIGITSADKKYTVNLQFNPGGKGFEGIERAIRFEGKIVGNKLALTKISDTVNDSSVIQTIPGYVVWAPLQDLTQSLQFVISSGDDVKEADGAVAFFEQIVNTIKFN